MISAWLLTGVGLLTTPTQETTEALKVGHWMQVRGRFDDEGRLVASRAIIAKPERYETIIGTLDKDERSREGFRLHGQPVIIDADVDYDDIRPGKWGGKRIKLQGRWRNQNKFSARKIQLRSGSGRDRLEGRIDEIEPAEGGYVARIMVYEIFLPVDLKIEHEGVFAKIPLSPERGAMTNEATTGRERNDDLDDSFGGGTLLTEDIGLFGQAVVGSAYEENYNLDDADDEDELKFATRLRMRLHWFVRDDLVFVTEGNWVTAVTFDDGSSPRQDEDMAVRFGETFAYWTDAFGVRNLDLQFGRQDFDDQREWIYDENLDALRVFWSQPAFAIEASLATQIGGNSNPRNREQLVSSLYLSNNSRKKHLAGYLFYRDIDAYATGSDSFMDEDALHVGVRALGEWIPDTKTWAEAAYLVGEREGRDVQAFAYDIGTTWEPGFADPFYMTVGYALGSGESSASGTDGRFRQTGFQDNSARFGGISSFRYYGELLRPELTNLGILTTGLGARITKNMSVDLVFHDYRFDVTTNDLDFFDPEDYTDIKPGSIAADPNLGWELDLILGYRAYNRWDFKLIGAYFEPGDALPGQEGALFARFQIRYRF